MGEITPVSTSVSNIAQIPSSIQIQSGVLPNGSCRTAACTVNLLADNIRTGDICEWIVRPNIGTSTRVNECNPRAMRLGPSGGIILLNIIGSQVSSVQMSLSVGAFITKNAPSSKIKTLVLSKNTDLQKTNPSSEEKAIDLYEEYFEVIDGEVNDDKMLLKSETGSGAILKNPVISNSQKNSPKSKSKEVAKSTKKASVPR